MRKSASIIIISRDTNRIFLLHRVNKPISWAGLAGKMEKGETPIQTISREVKEEIGLDFSVIDGVKVLGNSNTMGGDHYVSVGFVDEEFKVPNLKKDENDTYGWFSEKELPSPLHPGLMKSLNMVKNYLNLKENVKKTVKKLLNE